MNRRKKIIISITGITIIVLTLIGFTYAYFLTQISGNTNTKSIEVSTADLKLTYNDGNGKVIGTNVVPGYTTPSKTFTVTNNGNATVNNYKVYLESVVNTFTNTNDLVINMTCTSNKGKTCLGLIDKAFPTYNDELVSNSIDVGETQTYSLTVTYKESGVDQSVDMNKTFSGLIQIYDSKNIVDITGIVTNYNNGDYVEMHSDVKTSQINTNGEYKITGIMPGSHTFYVKDKEGNIRGTKTISINKSNISSSDDTTINVTNNTSIVKVNVTNINTELGMNINLIENPYKDNSKSLAYNIINNAQLNKNRTTYEPVPVTTPGTNINAVYSFEPKYYESNNSTTPITIETKYQDTNWTYADSFSFDSKTGKFSLVNPKTCKYSECYNSLIGKYRLTSDYENKLLKIAETSLTTIKYNFIYPIPSQAERTISKTEDDYGDSYYFRGDINDNYTNFNGMCWRIVRIEGDGSIKLVLEDKNTTCNNENYTGNFEYSYTQFGFEQITLSDGTNVHKNAFLTYKNGMYDKMKLFQTNKLDGVLDKLKSDDWCYDDTTYSDTANKNKIIDLDSYYQNKTLFYYDSYSRIWLNSTATLKCNGSKLKKYRDGITDMYVGALTADEIVFAGATEKTNNNSYFYLINDRYMHELSFLYRFMTITPTVFTLYENNYYVGVYNLTSTGLLTYNTNPNTLIFRPAITLKSGIEITSGDGTINCPYEIK